MEFDTEKYEIANMILSENTKVHEKNITPLYYYSVLNNIAGMEGTGFLLQVNSKYFCITAWHVIKAIFKKGDFYISTVEKVSKKSVKKNTYCDVAFVELTNKAVADLRNKNKDFLSLDDFELKNRKNTSNMIIFHGFPGGLSQLDQAKQTLNVKPFTFYTHFRKMKLHLRKYQISFMYDKEGWKNRYGQDVEQIDILGMSGSPIVENIILREPVFNYRFKIIAIATQWYKDEDWVKGVFVNVLFKLMAHELPELRQVFIERFGENWKNMY